MPTFPSRLFIISILGALSVVTPFAIDMYLPAFPRVAADMHVDESYVSLTLSSYFIALGFGQVFYGPLLDRFGRKRPLYVGLIIFILASFGCAFTKNIYALIALRFIQGVGGCAARVGSTAMVMDFFHAKESAKIFSILFLFVAISPLLAPSVGGFMMIWMSWRAVFFILGIIVTAIFALVYFKLPEGHQPDPSISLHPLPIIKEYIAIVKNPRFATYAFAGAFAFAGLFTYVAGSPIIFMEGFHLTPRQYSGVFALLASGFIGGSQLNVQLLRWFSSERLFVVALCLQVLTGLVFMIGTWFGWYGLPATLLMFFLFLGCAGIVFPNSSALALAPFSKYAGSASALLGFLQLGSGSLISTGISIMKSHNAFPIIVILGCTSLMGLCVYLIGHKRANDPAALVEPHS
jgi:DHA1 family bicyclomycin/chloramphenicol resistance-like MFS transporter